MNPKILIVDDEENMLLLLKKVLGKEGYQIICAASAEQGLEKIGEEAINLAIIDQRMPVINGLNLLQRLKTMDPDLPVIVITAFPSWEKEQEARAMGCLDYLSKPLNLKSLKEIIKNQFIAKRR
jgi:two-component system NtrC family response regulator